MLVSLRQLVRDAFADLNRRRDEPIPLENVDNVSLYGEAGVFDSMHLVGFLALLEEKIEDEYDLELSLTSEKAMSQRVRPFASVENLMAFIQGEAKELGVEVAI